MHSVIEEVRMPSKIAKLDKSVTNNVSKAIDDVGKGKLRRHNERIDANAEALANHKSDGAKLCNHFMKVDTSDIPFHAEDPIQTAMTEYANTMGICDIAGHKSSNAAIWGRTC